MFSARTITFHLFYRILAVKLQRTRALKRAISLRGSILHFQDAFCIAVAVVVDNKILAGDSLISRKNH